MKAVKYIGIVITVIIVLYLTAELILPDTFSLQSDIVITAADSTVFRYIADYNNRIEWDPWLAEEEEKAIAIDAKPEAVGSKFTWNGENIGSGYLLLQEIQENQYIKAKLIFTEPQKGEAQIEWHIHQSDNGVRVTWRLGYSVKYSRRIFFCFFIRPALLKSINRGLSNLKANIEV